MDPEDTARRILQAAPHLLSLRCDNETATDSDTALEKAVSKLYRNRFL